MTDTFERVKALMVREFQLDPAAIAPTVPLDALGVDSLAALEFLFALEDEFHVSLDGAADIRGGAVQDVVDAVEVARAPQVVAEAAD
jgi:acyl carrier protein